LFIELALSVFDYFSFIIASYFYFDISFDKIIREISFATFDITLRYLLRKRARIRQLKKQFTTIKKKKKTNKLRKRLYRLILCDEHILTYIETIYATKLRNCTILNLKLENKLQDLRTIAIATSTTRLKIALKDFLI